MTQRYAMLQRNLLYTLHGYHSGQTLGRSGRPEEGAVAIAVRNVSGRRRWSKLDKWLRAMVPGASHVTARAGGTSLPG